MTLARVLGLTEAPEFSTRNTVLGETPAAFAISRMVAGLDSIKPPHFSENVLFFCSIRMKPLYQKNDKDATATL